MTTYIVCEGDRDVQLLKRVLPEELVKNVKIAAAGSSYAIKSLACSLIVVRQSPVVIVADADTINPEQVEERRQDIEEIVVSVAANTPVKVILAVPAIEIIFFQDISLLSSLLGYPPSQEVLNLAVEKPKQALNQLIYRSTQYQNPSQLVAQLTNDHLKIIRNAPVIQELIQFLQGVRETADV